MRSRASRRRLSDNDIRCSASDRRWFPARPAQHVHRRRHHGKGRIPSALANAHGRNGKRRVETFSAGRAGAHRPSEALHPTRSSDALPRIARSASLPRHTLRKRIEMCGAGSRLYQFTHCGQQTIGLCSGSTDTLCTMPFRAFNLGDHLNKAVEEAGYTEPTPIQVEAIPKIMAGHDLIGIAQTGTGKTAAFVLPILSQLFKASGLSHARGIRWLILLRPGSWLFRSRKMRRSMPNICRHGSPR